MWLRAVLIVYLHSGVKSLSAEIYCLQIVRLSGQIESYLKTGGEHGP
jgi:hypothetical protein